jgi:hypothetical protein
LLDLETSIGQRLGFGEATGGVREWNAEDEQARERGSSPGVTSDGSDTR